MLVACVVGARPNFIKIAPLLSEIKRRGLDFRLIHTGQHYDSELNDVFFDQLEIPSPDVNLEIGSASHARQTGEALIKLEQDFIDHKPDLVVVVGDVNSTLAGALAAAKLNIPVAHVEAGYRSFDRTMPEETNRVIVDHISDFLFAPTDDAVANLIAEGISADKIHHVGNIMAETLLRNMEKIGQRGKPREMGLKPREYAVATIHRPENTDNMITLSSILAGFGVSPLPIIMPLHPRTQQAIKDHGLGNMLNARFTIAEPMPYIDLLSLVQNARLVLTDSGGLQEEACILQVPCITIRENTERTVTVDIGANRLVPADKDRILEAMSDVIGHHSTGWNIPELWDTGVSQRTIDILIDVLARKARKRQEVALDGVA
jgi:UDP-N-acetylglucosamine 2-epimerase (non-hydrolysing)